VPDDVIAPRLQPAEVVEAEAEAAASTGEQTLPRKEDAPPTHGRAARGARRRDAGPPPALATAGILVALLLLWIAGSALELWSSNVLPPPADVGSALVELVQTGTFWQAVRITVTEIVAVFAAALVIGFGLGMLFWKAPYLGRVCEPYLVSFYAVPFIVFYPTMVVIIGLNSWPIIVLATVMATIPMTLNTWIGLAGVSHVFWKLAAVLGCGRRQTIFRIAIPAAAPIVLAGVRLALIYSLIGSVSMEFLLAPNGLGYQIRYQYELFHQNEMVAYVLVVFMLAGLLAITIAAMEGWVLGRRRSS